MHTNVSHIYSPSPRNYQRTPEQRERFRKSLHNTLHILKSTEDHTPLFGCYGLHEWAMLYSTDETTELSSKFQPLPLRLELGRIAEVVEQFKPRCTHFDAIRFFPPRPTHLNTVQPLPTRITAPLFEQAGCIHVNMDLLKCVAMRRIIGLCF